MIRYLMRFRRTSESCLSKMTDLITSEDELRSLRQACGWELGAGDRMAATIRALWFLINAYETKHEKWRMTAAKAVEEAYTAQTEREAMLPLIRAAEGWHHTRAIGAPSAEWAMAVDESLRHLSDAVDAYRKEQGNG